MRMPRSFQDQNWFRYLKKSHGRVIANLPAHQSNLWYYLIWSVVVHYACIAEQCSQVIDSSPIQASSVMVDGAFIQVHGAAEVVEKSQPPSRVAVFPVMLLPLLMVKAPPSLKIPPPLSALFSAMLPPFMVTFAPAVFNPAAIVCRVPVYAAVVNGHGPAEVVNSAAVVGCIVSRLCYHYSWSSAAVVSNPSASSGSFVPVYAASSRFTVSDAVNPSASSVACSLYAAIAHGHGAVVVNPSAVVSSIPGYATVVHGHVAPLAIPPPLPIALFPVIAAIVHGHVAFVENPAASSGSFVPVYATVVMVTVPLLKIPLRTILRRSLLCCLHPASRCRY